jgi:acetyl-CoA acyltransferase 1
MGVGPAYAIPAVLAKAGLHKNDVDFYEINEAFASQAVFSVNSVGIPFEKVNVNGGAIAMGHPLGCSAYFFKKFLSLVYILSDTRSFFSLTAGARQIATALSIAKQTDGRVFVTSMCIGSGMGMAGLFVSEH